MANNASLVLLVEVRGVRVLLTGDIEPAAQAGLARTLHGLTVDVLKLPHHGSRRARTSTSWPDCVRGWCWCRWGPTTTTDTRRPRRSRRSRRRARRVLRTDRAGDLVVVDRDGELAASSR